MKNKDIVLKFIKEHPSESANFFLESHPVGAVKAYFDLPETCEEEKKKIEEIKAEHKKVLIEKGKRITAISNGLEELSREKDSIESERQKLLIKNEQLESELNELKSLPATDEGSDISTELRDARMRMSDMQNEIVDLSIDLAEEKKRNGTLASELENIRTVAADAAWQIAIGSMDKTVTGISVDTVQALRG